MDQKHCTHAWLGSFAARLMQLRPGLSLGAAVQSAVENIHQSGALEPLKAAEICAHNDFQARVAREAVREAQSLRYRAQFSAELSESSVAATFEA